MLAITKYAQRLIDDLDDLDYIERVKIQQKNWIGRSTGAEVDFKTTEGDTLTVYTTRPDTLFGATYMVISPEHPSIEAWANKLKNIDAIRAYRCLLYTSLGERQITVDCDVIQADGGTRCASITGGFVALWLACKKLLDEGKIEKMPLTSQVAAVSVGIYEDEAILDLNYAEDSHAIVDCNVVMTGAGDFVEIQGTGEGRPFTKDELNRLLSLGKKGTAKLCREQKKITGEL